jgi:nicotinate-nucleotide--dimethylbenzimidazole phosphoribosyltransferase
MITISPLNQSALTIIQSKIDSKTKPLGALGALESLALQLALIKEQRLANSVRSDGAIGSPYSNKKISLNKPTMLVFAGDHGINEENLSIAPSAVTKQMVINFLQGGAAINCFCQSNDIALTVVDCGILVPVSSDEMPKASEVITQQKTTNFVELRLGKGTNNFAKNRAMSIVQVKQGFSRGKALIEKQVEEGCEILLLGEMGIANTSSAAALMSALTSFDVKQCVGRGTGITDEQLSKKIALIEQALSRLSSSSQDLAQIPKEQYNADKDLTSEEVIEVLSQLGGFEIVQMVAAILAGAAANIPIVIDGFIVSVAALVALRLDKNVADYLIFSHVSQEKAHQALLKELLAAQTFTKHSGQALLDLGLRLGEGSGAALSLPLIQAAASFYNNMASFESAGVTV